MALSYVRDESAQINTTHPTDQHRAWLTELQQLNQEFFAASGGELEALAERMDKIDALFTSTPVASADGAIAKIEYLSGDHDDFARNVLGDVVRFLKGVPA